MQKEVELIIKDISLRHGVPYEVAKDVVLSQFHCTRESLKEGEHNKPETFKTVHLKYLGKFFATERRIKQISKSKEKDNVENKNE